MQIFGKFRKPLNDRDVVAAAIEKGVEVLPVSINYHFDEPEHGLLLGHAALDEKQMLRAVRALRAAFISLDGLSAAARKA